MGCAEARSPFAGRLRVSLRYDFFPPSWPGWGEMGLSKAFVGTLLVLLVCS